MKLIRGLLVLVIVLVIGLSCSSFEFSADEQDIQKVSDLTVELRRLNDNIDTLSSDLKKVGNISYELHRINTWLAIEGEDYHTLAKVLEEYLRSELALSGIYPK